MPEPHAPKFRVAIIGGGLGGLLLALFLQKDAPDVAVDIYESTAELAEVGAGIGFWPRTWELLVYLGLEDELRQISGARDSAALPVHYWKADEPEAVDFYELPPLLHAFHRADLQKILAKRLHTTYKIHFGKRLMGYDAPPDAGKGPIVLHFKDGTSAKCDLLVGADGVRSAVRQTMYGALADRAGSSGDTAAAERLRAMREPFWSREISYRGLVPAQKLAELGFKDVNSFVTLFGKNKHLLWYPICRGALINVVAFVSLNRHKVGARYDGPWVSEVTVDEVVRELEGWDPIVQKVLKSMERPLKWSIHECHDLPTYVDGRVLLIGDAAHAMRPHQGAGAGQAMEDAFILASILGHHSVMLKNLHRALRLFDASRRPAAQEVQHLSEANGMLYQLRGKGWEEVSAKQSHAGGFPLEALADVGRQVEHQMDWMFKGGVLEDRDRILQVVERELARPLDPLQTFRRSAL